MIDSTPDRIAFINFGGIGDEILFSPVIDAVREAYPDSHLTLILEARSGRIKELLPQVDNTLEIEVQKYSRFKLFLKLLKLLSKSHFAAVISSGSSPFIPIMLFISGTPIRIGFDTGRISRTLLTAAAPLFRKIYAGEMYFSLAETFLSTLQPDYQPNYHSKNPVIPKLKIHPSAREKAAETLAEYESHTPKQRIFIHPGVSRVSVAKNILKAWSLNYWKELMTELAIRYPEAHIYLTGGPDDAAVIASLEEYRQILSEPLRSRIFNLYGKTLSIQDLAGFFSLGDLLISVDSAPMHLALGLQLPIVAIFAPTDEKKLLPQSDKVQVAARNDLSCRPCLWDNRKNSCNVPICLEVRVSEVLNKVEMFLGPSENPEGILENILIKAEEGSSAGENNLQEEQKEEPQKSEKKGRASKAGKSPRKKSKVKPKETSK